MYIEQIEFEQPVTVPGADGKQSRAFTETEFEITLHDRIVTIARGDESVIVPLARVNCFVPRATRATPPTRSRAVEVSEGTYVIERGL